MATNWRSTLWDIILTILTLGIFHIQKRKKKIGGRGGQKIHKTALRKLIIYLYCVYKRLVRAAYFRFMFHECFTNMYNQKSNHLIFR